MADANQETGAGGIGYSTPPGGISGSAGHNLRIEMDALLRRHGVSGGLDAIQGGGNRAGVGPHQSILELVRTEDHQRLNAPNRDTMRREAMESIGRYPLGDVFWTEQSRSAFVAFVMKGTLPGPGSTWVLPYASWGEAQAAYLSLFSSAEKWDEWWKSVS